MTPRDLPHAACPLAWSPGLPCLIFGCPPVPPLLWPCSTMGSLPDGLLPLIVPGFVLICPGGPSFTYLSGWHRQMASSKLILYVLSPFLGFSELLRSSFIYLKPSAGRSSPLRRPLLLSQMLMPSMTIISTKQQYFRSEMCDVLLLPPNPPAAGIHWF